MKTMSMPGFTADASLYRTSEHYHMRQASTVGPELVVPQLRCPCPPGLLGKASRLCHDPAGVGGWCRILDRCLDCFDI